MTPIVEYKFTPEIQKQREVLWQIMDGLRADCEARVRAIPAHYPPEERSRLLDKEIRRYLEERQPFIDSLCQLHQFATVIIFHERAAA